MSYTSTGSRVMAHHHKNNTRIRRNHSQGPPASPLVALVALALLVQPISAFRPITPPASRPSRTQASWGANRRIAAWERRDHSVLFSRRTMVIAAGSKDKEEEGMMMGEVDKSSRRPNRFKRFIELAILPAFAALTTAIKPANAYRDLRMSPETRIVAAILGRFIIPIGLCLYFAVNHRKFARDEAKRVRQALDAQQKKKEAYVEEMKAQGFNLGGVGGSLFKEEEDMLVRVEKGEQLLVSEKASWVKLLQRAQYSRDVIDGKVQPNADVAIMTKKELKRVVSANKTVKEAGFKPDYS